ADRVRDAEAAAQRPEIDHAARRRPRECVCSGVAGQSAEADYLTAWAHRGGAATGAAESAQIDDPAGRRPRESVACGAARQFAGADHLIARVDGNGDGTRTAERAKIDRDKAQVRGARTRHD